MSHPNAFVSLPITSTEVKVKLMSIQKQMIEKDESITSLKVSPETFHLTMLVIKLDKVKKQKSLFQEALDRCAREINPILSTVNFEFKLDKLSNFDSDVVFITMSDETAVKAFKDAAGQVRSIFAENGLPSTTKRGATPHVTLFKTGKDSGGSQLNPETYEGLEDVDCGIESFNTLQLCSMSMRKQASGYYHVICDTSLSSNASSVADGGTSEAPANN